VTAFLWQGTDTLGLPQHGILEAPSLKDAQSRLAGLGISGVRIRQQSPLRKTNDSAHIQMKVRKPPRPKIGMSKKQLRFFCRQLADLLSAGIPVIDALDLLEEGAKNGRTALMRALKNSLHEGLKLGDAMARHPAVFNPYFVSLVRSEESAGQLHRALIHLANHLEQIESLHQKIRQSLMQPALILLTAVLVTWLLLTFVMPEFAKMYTQQEQQLPNITRWVMSLSLFLQSYGGPGLVLIAACSIATLALVKNVPSFGLVFDRLLLRLPVFGPLIQRANVADFSRTLAAMLTAGVPLNEGLLHAGACSRNAVFSRSLSQITSEIENGAALHQAMVLSACFPAPFCRMTRLGEETGKLDQILEHASVVYREDFHRTVNSLLPLIEPILMLILGLVVGGLILAMYLPIFSMGALLHT
jgi:type IV pilus assembly protein PilC